MLRRDEVWVVLGVLAPIGMLLVSGLMLLDLRRDTWIRAEQTSKNLLQIMEHDIDRNIDLYDLSLRGVIDNLKIPGVANINPDLRRLILFDRAAIASNMGVMLVLDENGDIIDDADAGEHREDNYADREYFQTHKTGADQKLFISKPLISRRTGAPMIALSRRIDKPDGSFGGVVVGTLKLSYFMQLFDQIGLGCHGAITLYRTDGMQVMRYPFVPADIGKSIAGTPDVERLFRSVSGSFTATSGPDAIEQHHTFTRVGDSPLVLDVAVATDEIELEWRSKALVIGCTSLVLCGLTIVLAIWVGRELRQRAVMQAELARLSLTDSLTGLPNRRRFDDVFPRSWEAATRTGRSLSLLIVDADHFKRVNDRYGHHVGDDVLRSLARCLSASVPRSEDLVCRVGGEEFALLLPDTDVSGALRIAQKIHREIAACTLWPAGLSAGAVTVSIGVACSESCSPSEMASDLYRVADNALYDAKVGCRNRTRFATIRESNLDQPILRYAS